jgi:heat shock protein HtpX
MYRAIAANKRNTVFIIIAFILVIGVITSIFGFIYQNFMFTILGLGIATIYALIQYALGNRLAIAMAGARPITKEQAPDLFRIVENLSITEGIMPPPVYIIQDEAPNAFASGTKPENSIIAVTTGLLAIMDKDELTGVIAHEMSHIKNYDVRVSLIVFALMAVIGLFLDIFVRGLFFGGNRRDGLGGNPITIIIALVALLILGPLMQLFQLAASRQREYLADASGVMMTRYPEGLESALGKLEGSGKPLKRQRAAMSHLYFSDPNPKKGQAFAGLFATHPPLEKRIERLRDNATKF